MGSTYTIGRLAELAGVNVETVRFYERRGLLEQPPKPESGYREYDSDHLWRLQFIARGKDLGFTLAEIADLLGPGDRSVDQVVEAATGKLAELDERQHELDRTRRRLERLAELCGTGGAADCLSLGVDADSLSPS